MSKKYSIAIVLPTRGRTDALRRSVFSLIDNATDMSRIQIMFGFDNDDDAGVEYFTQTLKTELDQLKINYTALSFVPMGYDNINHYGNVLAVKSDAEWTVFWNDDAIMNTSGWDQIIADRTGDFKLLAFHTHNDHPYSIFPIVPVKWLELIGHHSPHQMIDAWLSQNAYMLDIWERIEVHVTHDRHDLTGNNNDATFKGRTAFEGNPNNPIDFHHTSNTIKRMKECDTLATYMKSQGISTDWWEAVKARTQDPWVKLKENDVNRQMFQFSMQINNDLFNQK
jgi:hypothetical protein